MIKTTVKETGLFDHETECLILFCPETAKPEGVLKQIDSRLGGAVAQAYKSLRFEGKLNQTLLLNTGDALKASNLLLAGAGKLEEVTADRLSQAAGTAAKLAEKSNCKKIAAAVPEGPLAQKVKKSSIGKNGLDEPARAVTEGMLLALYHFDPYKTRKKDEPEPSRVGQLVLLSPSKARTASIRRAAGWARQVAEGVELARDLQRHPANRATPAFLAKTARALAKKHGLRCKILGEAEMKKLGMGALLGVSRGSSEPAQMIVLEYSGGKKNDRPIAIVGKGVTFDTGGISLKPSAHMDEMKMDMSGGAVTLATLQAAAALKLPVNLVGIVPAAENMPGGKAIKPGDILTSLSGKTIEVLNTDAEGRLILSDALTYAARFKPKLIVDLATLTGAVIMALGHHACAVAGNDGDLIKKLYDSGKATGERVWELPLWEEYEKAMKSDIADLKNIAAPGVGAGTITGAAFLKAFVDDCPWAHLDIAGTAWGEERPYAPKGASGFGVRLLLHFLAGSHPGGVPADSLR